MSGVMIGHECHGCSLAGVQVSVSVRRRRRQVRCKVSGVTLLLLQDPYEKVILQGETLDAMKDLKERIREEVSLGTPKPYRNRALSFFRSIEPYVKFSKRIQLLDDDNDHPIEHSRVEDLIQHAVWDRCRHFTQHAWDSFLQLLKKHNIPRSIFNHDTLDELDQRPRLRRRLSVGIPVKTLRKR